jgi:hypothetical protein
VPAVPGAPAAPLTPKEQAALDKHNESLAKQAAARAKAEGLERNAKLALGMVAQAVNTDINTATALAAHPGLKSITGAYQGALAKNADNPAVVASSPVVFGGDGLAALALYKRVIANTTMRALATLKQQSATGASGLGQLSDREGEMLKNAMAALDLAQPTAAFKKNLDDYITALRDTKACMEKAGVPAEPETSAADDLRRIREAARQDRLNAIPQ